MIHDLIANIIGLVSILGLYLIWIYSDELGDGNVGGSDEESP